MLPKLHISVCACRIPSYNPQYQTPLHQFRWHFTPLILSQIPTYQILLSQKHYLPYQQPDYHVHNVKTLTEPHICKNLFNIEKKSIKIYACLAEPFDQLYKGFKMAGRVTLIPTKNPETQSKGYYLNKVCDYHSEMKGRTTKTCRALGGKIHKLIEAKLIH